MGKLPYELVSNISSINGIPTDHPRPTSSRKNQLHLCDRAGSRRHVGRRRLWPGKTVWCLGVQASCSQMKANQIENRQTKQQNDWKGLRSIQNWLENFNHVNNMANVVCACSASHLSMLFHRNAGVLEGITSWAQGLVQRITLLTAEIQKLILIIEETWPNFLGFVLGETWPNYIHYQNYRHQPG